MNGKVTADHPANWPNGDFFGEVDTEQIRNTPFGPIHCGAKKKLQPGNIENRLVVILKKSDGTLGICHDTAYVFNQGEWNGFENHVSFSRANGPCGPGEYKAQTWSYANLEQDGEPWEGGELITSFFHSYPPN